MDFDGENRRVLTDGRDLVFLFGTFWRNVADKLQLQKLFRTYRF